MSLGVMSERNFYQSFTIFGKFLCRKYLLWIAFWKLDTVINSSWAIESRFSVKNVKRATCLIPELHVSELLSQTFWTGKEQFRLLKMYLYWEQSFKFSTIPLLGCEHERSHCKVLYPPLYIVWSIQDSFPAIGSPKDWYFEKLSWLQEWLSIIR